MADGSVVVSVDMDDKAAQKKLDDLRKEIDRTARTIDKSTEKRSGIETQLDNARQAAQELQKELDEINARRREVNATLEGTSDKSGGGAAVDPVAWAAAKEEAAELDARAAELAPKVKIADKEVAKLEKDAAKVTAQIDEQTQKLDAMTEEYGATERAAQSAAQGLNISQAVQQATASIKQGAKNILKWGFGIRSAFILMRKLRNAIKEGVNEFAKADPATKAALDGIKKSLTGLKASFGAAFAPLLQAIAPILQKLIGWLTQAANAVQQFFAVLSGKSTYKRVINANNALAESYAGAGGAAKDAQKQLLGFDEINQLSDQSSGGGGGGGGDAAKVEWEEVELDAWTNKLKPIIEWVQEHLEDILFVAKNVGAALLAWKISKVLVNGLASLLGTNAGLAGGIVLGVTGLYLEWDAIKKSLKDGLNWKNFAELLTGALFTVAAGAFIGKKFGNWFKGAAIGGIVASVGAIAAGIGSALKNGVNWTEALSITGGFAGLGASIGALIGHPIAGAIIGTVTGLLATAITAAATQTRKRANEILNDSELWQSLQASKERIDEMLTESEDLIVHVNSISADIDESTLINLNAAAELIDEIFSLDEKENKTAEEISVIQGKIETLNGLGLPGINLAFDEATGHVQGTRAEVMGLLEDLKQQYQLEAMKQAYIEYYKAQADEEIKLKRYKEERATKEAELTAATNAQTEAQKRLKEANDALTEAKIGLDAEGMIKWTKAVEDAKAELLAAKDTTVEAQGQFNKVQEAIKNAEEALAATTENIASLDGKFAEIRENAAKAGNDTVTGFVDEVVEKAPEMADAFVEGAENMIDEAKDALDIHSPSGVTRDMGENTVDGFIEGINDRAPTLIETILSMLAEVKEAFSSTINDLIDIWNTDLGHPHMQFPIFALQGAFNFQTGETPQIGIAGWHWLAKGGILDRATLIGAGEAGKEAVLPLERNTGWIKTLADGIIDRIESSGRFADYITGRALPAVVTGQLVPPRAASGGGGILGDGDVEKLVSGLVRALGDSGSGDDNVTRIYLDGKVLTEVVTKRQKGAAYAYGV